MRYAGDGSRQIAFLTAVKVCMARNGIKNARALAPLVDIEERSLYRKMEFKSNFTLQELWRLVRVLNPNEDELRSMMGGI